MLLYHPFFDPHHCAFRLLRLLDNIGSAEIEVERMRVWDFYLLFPTALQHARLPQASRKIRLIAKQMENRYEIVPDPRVAFTRLKPIQEAAFAHLVGLRLIDAEAFISGKVVRTPVALPSSLATLIQDKNAQADPMMDFLVTTFLSTPLFGKGGIRMRTDLFDHRYDLP